MRVITRHIYRTSDGQYVLESELTGSGVLAYAPGNAVPDHEVEQRGLTAWTTDQAVPRPTLVVDREAASRPLVFDADGRRVRPVGTIPPGHATASVPGVAAEVAPPVVAVADVTPSNPPPPATAAAERSQSNRNAGKPARSREV